ncbi:hypothetical protein HDU93_007905 [Gonapodya sp. JEL0774]|nr:hypothetical protein HDU93_007905 [Gonapodya sp. JEL0774]
MLLGEAWKTGFSVTADLSGRHIEPASLCRDGTTDTEKARSIEGDLKPFVKSLAITIEYLTKKKHPKQLLLPPTNHALHFLVNFPTGGDFENAWFPNGDYAIVNLMVDLLDHILLSLPLTVSKVGPPPLIRDELPTLLLVLGALAKGSGNCRTIIERAIFPESMDRSVPIEQNANLTGRVVRLLTTVVGDSVRHCAGDLLFVLCGEDPRKLVDRIGYGSAAGFLFQRDLLQNPDILKAGYATASVGAAHIKEDLNGSSARPVNPITGQLESAASSIKGGDDMTEEEKEMEMERLLVLFDRLRKTGIVTVGLPEHLSN